MAQTLLLPGDSDAVNFRSTLDADHQWFVVTQPKMDTVAHGVGPAQWSRTPYGGVVHRQGHEDDYLYFRTPLRGDFSVTAAISGFGHREGRLMHADRWLGPKYTRKHYEYGRVGVVLGDRAIDPELRHYDWYNWRVDVKDGVYSVFINDRKIHEESVGDRPDPWLAIRAHCSTTATVKYLRIHGKPTIPDELRISDYPDLTGWTGTFFRHSVGDSQDDWSKNGRGHIVGRKRDEWANTGRQSILQYHRLLIEDSDISWKFAYSPNTQHVHPAIGRLVFLLRPEGVRIHWLTDGKWEEGDLPQDNAFEEPDNALLNAPLPLKVNVPNEAHISIRGNTVTLTLNGQKVFRRELNAGNRRQFGLFHFPGRTSAEAWDIVYRGDWPKSLLDLNKQELAGRSIPLLAVDTKNPNQYFTHDFATDGLPASVFRTVNGTLDGKLPLVDVTKDGLYMARPGAKNWISTTVQLGRALSGDFDIVANFVGAKMKMPDKNKGTGPYVSIDFRNPTKDAIYLIRRMNGSGGQIIEGLHRTSNTDGKLKYASEFGPETGDAGTLRISRRGRELYWLFAASGEQMSRIVRHARITGDDILPNGIALVAQTGGQGHCEVIWKDITIRAEQLSKRSIADARTIEELNVHAETFGRSIQTRFCQGRPRWWHFSADWWQRSVHRHTKRRTHDRAWKERME